MFKKSRGMQSSSKSAPLRHCSASDEPIWCLGQPCCSGELTGPASSAEADGQKGQALDEHGQMPLPHGSIAGDPAILTEWKLPLLRCREDWPVPQN